MFVTQHHGVIPHFSMEPELMGEYLVDNYEDCQRRYADAGVSAVFTGHMHANDIDEYHRTEAGNTLYDIETCATVTYPSDIRFRHALLEARGGDGECRGDPCRREPPARFGGLRRFRHQGYYEDRRISRRMARNVSLPST